MPTEPLVPATVRKTVAFELEAIWKSGVVCVVVAWRARVASGVVVPSPNLPVALSKINCPPFRLPNLTVDEACRPFERRSVVEVLFTVAPKFVVVVNGKATLPAA